LGGPHPFPRQMGEREGIRCSFYWDFRHKSDDWRGFPAFEAETPFGPVSLAPARHWGVSARELALLEVCRGTLQGRQG